ncbi:MAG: hypothetical protein F6K11_34600 [Leptolyngbya sp. SIO3F4]|nr:hypothetical protein [Leptolyngbya sp. SIO3F4]
MSLPFHQYKYEFSLGAVRRLWHDRIIRPLALGLAVLMISANVSDGMTQKVPLVEKKAPHEHHYQAETPPLPLTVQTRNRLHRHQFVTGASMTMHNLTAAHFFGRDSVSKLSSEAYINSEQS